MLKKMKLWLNFDKFRDILEKTDQDLKKYLTIMAERLAEPLIKEYKIKIEEIIHEIKQLLHDRSIHDALEMQIDVLEPLLKELRDIYYKSYSIEQISTKKGIVSYALNKQRETIKSREIPLTTFDYE